MQKRTTLSFLLGLALLGGAASQAAGPGRPGRRGRIDERATTVLRDMSDYLAGLHAFTVHVVAVDEVVTRSGQKIQQVSRSAVSVKRPNKLRSDREGPLADLIFRYDGRTISLFGRRNGYYAIAPAPGSLDAMIDQVRTEYGLEAPAADLLFSNPYEGLMSDVVSAQYVGLEPIGEVQAHHLAFRGKEVDWQIWIQDGAEPLPLRYVITSKMVKGSPEFSADLSQWDTNARLTDEIFAFTPPPGSTRIQFLKQKD